MSYLTFLLQYQYANYSSPEYKDTGKGFLKFQLINQRSDFSFALFSGGLSNVRVKTLLPYYFDNPVITCLCYVPNSEAFLNFCHALACVSLLHSRTCNISLNDV